MTIYGIVIQVTVHHLLAVLATGQKEANAFNNGGDRKIKIPIRRKLQVKLFARKASI